MNLPYHRKGLICLALLPHILKILLQLAKYFHSILVLYGSHLDVRNS